MPAVMSHRPGLQAAMGVELGSLAVRQALCLHEVRHPEAEGHEAAAQEPRGEAGKSLSMPGFRSKLQYIPLALPRENVLQGWWCGSIFGKLCV